MNSVFIVFALFPTLSPSGAPPIEARAPVGAAEPGGAAAPDGAAALDGTAAPDSAAPIVGPPERLDVAIVVVRVVETTVDAGTPEIGAIAPEVGVETPPDGAVMPARDTAGPLEGGRAPDGAPPPLDGAAEATGKPEGVRDGVRIGGGAKTDVEIVTS